MADTTNVPSIHSPLFHVNIQIPKCWHVATADDYILQPLLQTGVAMCLSSGQYSVSRGGVSLLGPAPEEMVYTLLCLFPLAGIQT